MKVAIFSATIAFLAAMIAQWVSHRFTIKRENIKYSNEVIQEFILPNINNVLLYIDTETTFRKDHDVEVKIEPEEIVNNLKSNVKYANAHLVNALFDYQDSVTYFDGRGEGKDLATLKLFYIFLQYSVSTLRESDFENEYLVNNLRQRLRLYGVAYILTDLVGKEDVMNLLSYKWAWSSNIYDKISSHILERIIRENELQQTNICHERLQIISIIENEFKNSDVSDSEFLFVTLTNAREMAELRGSSM